jgi:hypothetical protein
VSVAIQKSLEIEWITLFPKVAQRLADNGLKPVKAKSIRQRKHNARQIKLRR